LPNISFLFRLASRLPVVRGCIFVICRHRCDSRYNPNDEATGKHLSATANHRNLRAHFRAIACLLVRDTKNTIAQLIEAPIHFSDAQMPNSLLTLMRENEATLIRKIYWGILIAIAAFFLLAVLLGPFERFLAIAFLCFPLAILAW